MATPSWFRVGNAYGGQPTLSLEPNQTVQIHGVDERTITSHTGKSASEAIVHHKFGGLDTGTLETIGLPITQVVLRQTERVFEGNPLLVAEGATPTTAKEIEQGIRYAKALVPTFAGIDTDIEITVTGAKELYKSLANAQALVDEFKKSIVKGALTAGEYAFKPKYFVGATCASAMCIMLGPNYVCEGALTNDASIPGPSTLTFRFRKFVPTTETDVTKHPTDAANPYGDPTFATIKTAAGDVLYISTLAGFDATEELDAAPLVAATDYFTISRTLTLSAGSTPPREEFTINALPVADLPVV